jgi:hypothetical protein
MLKTHIAARLAAMSFVLASAVAAHAFSLDLMSHGNYSFPGGTLFAVNETVIYQNSDATIPSLTAMTYTADSNTLVGSGIYTNGADSFSFAFTFTDDIPTDGFSSTQNAHAIWTYTSGTGGFAGLAGSGVLTSNFNAPLGATSLTTLSGRLEAVPEPASVAALSFGALALVRRRKKS